MRRFTAPLCLLTFLALILTGCGSSHPKITSTAPQPAPTATTIPTTTLTTTSTTTEAAPRPTNAPQPAPTAAPTATTSPAPRPTTSTTSSTSPPVTPTTPAPTVRPKHRYLVPIVQQHLNNIASNAATIKGISLTIDNTFPKSEINVRNESGLPAATSHTIVSIQASSGVPLGQTVHVFNTIVETINHTKKPLAVAHQGQIIISVNGKRVAAHYEQLVSFKEGIETDSATTFISFAAPVSSKTIIVEFSNLFLPAKGIPTPSTTLIEHEQLAAASSIAFHGHS